LLNSEVINALEIFAETGEFMDLTSTGITNLGNTTINGTLTSTSGTTTLGNTILGGTTINGNLTSTLGNTILGNTVIVGTLTVPEISTPSISAPNVTSTTLLTVNNENLGGIITRNDTSVTESTDYVVIASPIIPTLSVPFAPYNSGSVGPFPPFIAGTMTLTGQSGILGISITLEGVTSVNQSHVEIWKNVIPFLEDTVGPGIAGSSFNSAFIPIPVLSTTDTSISVRIYNAAATLGTVKIALMSL